MTTSIDALEPRPVWQLFAEIARVPRPSKKEARIQAHMKEWAARHGFPCRQDRAGNMVIQVPASPGCEHAPVTILQGHLDMVCEANAGTQIDFENDPIRLVVDSDDKGQTIVRADGTTLGADNGIGVALAMAAATSPDVRHGPLELLCTVDEEMGMTGAKALEPDFLKGRRMLNLDSEDDEVIYIGCAGGMDSTLTWNLKTATPAAGGETVRVTVAGLKGGHTGGDIHLNRGNAIKLLVRTLLTAGEKKLQLVSFAGGSKRNAIPREASAVVCGPAGLRDKLQKAAATVRNDAVQHGGEAGCAIRLEPTGTAAAAAATDSLRVLTTLAALPHGVLAVVPEIAGLVQTSNSTSTVEATKLDGKLQVVTGCLSRSSKRSELHTTVRQIAAIGQLGKAKVVSGNEYPGWAPDVNSPTLAQCKRIYRELFGQEAKVTAIHAGLECGLIGERMGEGTMDMVSFGPHIDGAHSPDERIWVASVQKSWKFLGAVLAELAK